MVGENFHLENGAGKVPQSIDKKKKKKNRLLDDIRRKEKPFLEVTEIM